LSENEDFLEDKIKFWDLPCPGHPNVPGKCPDTVPEWQRRNLATLPIVTELA